MKERSVSPEEVIGVLSEWPVGKVSEVSFDALGTINQTWLVTAETGRYAIRLSGHDDVSKLQRECDLLEHVASKGIPAMQPVRTVEGRPFVERDGGLWMLSPFAPGFQTDRKVMTPAQDRGTGRYLALLFDALADCPHDLAKRRSLGVDVAHTLAEIGRIEQLIRAFPNAGEYESHALGRLEARRKWIEAHADETISGLMDLPVQVIHGDYQERNLFFDDKDCVVALVDWDNAWIAPREWEIVRTLNFVMLFDPARGRTFVEGFLERADLDIDALDRAAWAYSVNRAHDLFLYKEIYDRGNERTRQFLRPGKFTPPYENWVPVRDALKRL